MCLCFCAWFFCDRKKPKDKNGYPHTYGIKFCNQQPVKYNYCHWERKNQLIYFILPLNILFGQIRCRTTLEHLTETRADLVENFLAPKKKSKKYFRVVFSSPYHIWSFFREPASVYPSVSSLDSFRFFIQPYHWLHFIISSTNTHTTFAEWRPTKKFNRKINSNLFQWNSET